MVLFCVTRRIRLHTARTVRCKQIIRHGSRVPPVKRPMGLILGLDDASLELHKSLLYRFASDCQTKFSKNPALVILNNLSGAHAPKYPDIIHAIVDRRVAFPLGSFIPFEQLESHKDGKHYPHGVWLKSTPTIEVSKICTEMLEALHGLPGIEKIQTRHLMYVPFSQPQIAAAARETAKALKVAFPEGISLRLATKLTLLEAQRKDFEPTYRGDFYFKGAKKDAKQE